MTEYPFIEYNKFFDEYNIKNGVLANQENLNKSVNLIKKELNVLYNIQQIVAGKKGIPWRENVKYQPGEIVYYNGQHFCAKKENINTIPEIIDYWDVIDVSNFTQYLTADGFLSKTNEIPYTPTKPYHPSTKKYVDDLLERLKKSDDVFLRLDRPLNKPYTPILDYQPATKRYVDTRILQMRTDANLEVQSAKTANGLKIQDKNGIRNLDSSKIFYGLNEFEFMNGYEGLCIGGDSNSYIRTTASGFLPYSKDTQNGSTIGNSQWKFSEVWTHNLYADEFYGKTNSENADVAEKYTCNEKIEYGYLVGIAKHSKTSLILQVLKSLQDCEPCEHCKNLANLGKISLKSDKLQTLQTCNKSLKSDKLQNCQTLADPQKSLKSENSAKSHEIEKYNKNTTFIGVISQNPGVKLNTKLKNGVYVALKGRVKVKIKGNAKKGDVIIPYKNGLGKVKKFFNIFSKKVGICLSDSIVKNGINEVEIYILY